jgi:lipopolysaccharide/colanic/teichoic acid biosynthesis glycosyltransferase
VTKRILDLAVSLLGLLALSPLLVPVMIAIWLQDYRSPFYIAPRVGKNGRIFRMVKLRSMVMNADKSGVDSTKANDPRITPVGQFVRRYKLDEIVQLWNVLRNDMSLVGPRPQVERDVRLYTAEEKKMLSVKPGITDFASIVFADEGDILKGSDDPDLRYNQIIRPWKSRLAIFCIEHQSLALDLKIIYLTAFAVLNRTVALQGVVGELERLGAEPMLITTARREQALLAYPPPGATEIVRSREATQPA